MNVKELKPYWVLVAGFLLLLIFVLIIRMPARDGRRLGPGGTRQPWLGPGGIHQPWLGPGGTQYEGFANQEGPTFTMFGVDWCPHCVKAKPMFESMGPTTTIAGHTVYLRYINPETNKAAAEGYKLDGFPTFYFENQGSKVKYEGPRNADGFREFLEQQLAGYT